MRFKGRGLGRARASAEADLGQNALTGENFGRQANHEAHHGQPAIPGLGEVDKTEAGLGSVSHGKNPRGKRQCNETWRVLDSGGGYKLGCGLHG